MKTVLYFIALICMCLAYASALPYPDGAEAHPEALQADESRWGGGWGGRGWGRGWGRGGGWGHGGGWGYGGGWGHGGHYGWGRGWGG